MFSLTEAPLTSSDPFCRLVPDWGLFRAQAPVLKASSLAWCSLFSFARTLVSCGSVCRRARMADMSGKHSALWETRGCMSAFFKAGSSSSSISDALCWPMSNCCGPLNVLKKTPTTNLCKPEKRLQERTIKYKYKKIFLKTFSCESDQRRAAGYRNRTQKHRTRCLRS